MIVYIVTCVDRDSACYGHHFCGVFSSYRKAKEWAIDNLEGGWTITRYQLDKNYREVMEDRD